MRLTRKQSTSFDNVSTQTQHEQEMKLKKKKAVFQPRSSPLDYETLEKEKNPMRGFFVLFWMIMLIYTILTFYLNYRKTGSLVSWKLGMVLVRDVESLVLSDAIFVFSTFYVVFLQKMIISKFIGLRLGFVLQHLCQAVWFCSGLWWIWKKNFPWVQSGTLVIHSISLLLKQHGYTSYNIELGYLQRKAGSIQVVLKKQDHSKEEETRLLNQLKDYEDELTKCGVTFPSNISFYNYFLFLLSPTFVYELEYPRTNGFRPLYFLGKVISTLFTFALLYITVEHYINPVIQNIPNETFAESLIQLLLPFAITYLMIFYIIFECICNAFAEITCFADRGFYDGI